MSSKPFTLYWSHLEKYEACPQQFLWSRGWGTIDLGGGPGRRKPLVEQKSRHHAVMGIVIQAVVERFYNDELWRQPAGLLGRLEDLTRSTFEHEIARNYIDYRAAPAQVEMLNVCLDGVRGFMQTLKHQRLLGPYAKSEVDLLAYVDKYTPIGGKADLIIRREDTGLSILDGKNSQSKGKYTNPDQLRWYGLVWYLAYRQLPDRLGFLYWRYPAGFLAEGSHVPEEGVDWVPFTKDDMKGLAARAVEARKGMEKERFDPCPVPSHCKFCDYEDVCAPRQTQKEGNRRVKKNSEPIFAEAQGFVQFGFGPATPAEKGKEPGGGT